MAFVARIGDPKRRIRVYVHTAGFEEVYKKRGDDAKGILTANEYRCNVLDALDDRIRSLFAYFLGIVWGDSQTDAKMFDLFGYQNFEALRGPAWQRSNPDISAWVFRNGVYVPPTPPNSLTCEDSMIMLGTEGDYRRSTSGLQDYLTGIPSLGPLEPSYLIIPITDLLKPRDKPS